MSCDVIGGVGYYKQAVELMRALGNKQGLVEALSTMAARGGGYMVTLSALKPVPLDECLNDIAEALSVTRQIGWQAGEAMTYGYSALLLAVRGEVGRAIEDGTRGLALAEQIEHQQWMVSNGFALGGLCLEFLDFAGARARFEMALATARAIHSPFVISMGTAFLALEHTATGDHAGAEALLSGVVHIGTPMETIGQRMAWFALAHLELARGKPAEALEIADRLALSTRNIDVEGLRAVPYLAHLKGEALAALHRYDEAEKSLREGERAGRRLDSIRYYGRPCWPWARCTERRGGAMTPGQLSSVRVNWRICWRRRCRSRICATAS